MLWFSLVPVINHWQKMVPQLAQSIKVASLVLVSDTSADSHSHEEQLMGGTHAAPEGVDGILQGSGILRFNETIDM